jgi:hypothetical protein
MLSTTGSPSGPGRRSAVTFDRMVMPRSCSSSPVSMARTPIFSDSFAPRDERNNASTSVVLPWSTCATTAMLRNLVAGTSTRAAASCAAALHSARWLHRTDGIIVRGATQRAATLATVRIALPGKGHMVICLARELCPPSELTITFFDHPRVKEFENSSSADLFAEPSL